MKNTKSVKTALAALWMAGTLAAASLAQPPLRPLDGGTVAEVQAGAKVWSDRDYIMTAWPESLQAHRSFLLSSIRSSRFEVFAPGYVVVLTPLNEQHNQSAVLREAGFAYVDLEPFHPYLIREGRHGQPCIALQRAVQTGDSIEFGYYGIALWSRQPLPVSPDAPEVAPLITIPTVDISGHTQRHVIVAAGTEVTYQGHVDTVLMPDGKTMFAVWAINHAGYLGPLARSDDAGLTWQRIETPENWREMRTTTPTIHRLVDPQGTERLFAFAGQDFPGRLRQSYSEDGGRTWTPMQDTGLAAECPPKSILAFDDGRRLVMWCDRRDPTSSSREDVAPVVWKAESLDGGLTWSEEQVVIRVPTRWAQPAVIRSPDGRRAVMLMRYNGQGPSPLAVSRDGGQTWSEAREAPLAVTGHRPNIVYAPDGRLVVVFRDMAGDFQRGLWTNPTAGHFVAWVGTFDDLFDGREGQYRIKLMHSHAGRDNAYSGLEVLPDGTIVATNYIKYTAGPEKHSIVSTRFTLAETDALRQKLDAPE
jgi:hypothetical protein